MASAPDSIEIVGQGDPMPRRDFVDLVFAVAVKRRAIDARQTECSMAVLRPFEDGLIAGVTDCKLSALMIGRQTHDQTADLMVAPGSIDVGARFPIQFVQLDFDAAKLLIGSELRQEELGDDVDDAGSIRTE